MISAQVLKVSSSSPISSQVGNWQVESLQSYLWGWPANQRCLLLPPAVQRDEWNSNPGWWAVSPAQAQHCASLQPLQLPPSLVPCTVGAGEFWGYSVLECVFASVIQDRGWLSPSSLVHLKECRRSAHPLRLSTPLTLIHSNPDLLPLWRSR